MYISAINICLYVYIYICEYVCLNMYIYIGMCMYTYVYTIMYAYIYVVHIHKKQFLYTSHTFHNVLHHILHYQTSECHNALHNNQIIIYTSYTS